jgi:hypothetical protein
MIQLNKKTNCKVVWNEFLPSCFNNLTTRRIFGPEFFKSKKSWQKTGSGVCIERYGVVIRIENKKMNQGEVRVKMNPRRRSQPSIQPHFNIFQTYYVVTLGKRISSKSYIYHTKMINKLSKRIVG